MLMLPLMKNTSWSRDKEMKPRTEKRKVSNGRPRYKRFNNELRRGLDTMGRPVGSADESRKHNPPRLDCLTVKHV